MPRLASFWAAILHNIPSLDCSNCGKPTISLATSSPHANSVLPGEWITACPRGKAVRTAVDASLNREYIKGSGGLPLSSIPPDNLFSNSMLNNTLNLFNAPPSDPHTRPVDRQRHYFEYEQYPAQPSMGPEASSFATMTYDDPVYQQFLEDWPLFLAELNPEYSSGPQHSSPQVASHDSLSRGCLMSAPLGSGPPSVEVVGDYYDQSIPSNLMYHATGIPYTTPQYTYNSLDDLGIPLNNCSERATGAAASSVLWSPSGLDPDILPNSVSEMKLGHDLLTPLRPFQIPLPPTTPPEQPQTYAWAGSSEETPAWQKAYAGGRAVGAGSRRQHHITPYDHGLKDQWWLREEPPITALHTPVSHSSTRGLSYEDSLENSLENAGTQNQASPISTHVKNNDSNGEDPLLDFSWLSPAPSTSSSTKPDRKEKKRLSDARRSKAQTEAKASLKTLFPESTCNQAESTAIKVIRYITTTGDVPQNMGVVEDWWWMASGLVQGQSHTLSGLRHAPVPRTLLSALSDKEKKARHKELKRAADRLRNGARGALTSELCEIFGPCTNLEALQRASDYLAFAKLTGQGGISIPATYWHGSSAYNSGPFFPSA